MGLLGPRVDRHLIADEGEVIVDEVEKHWAAIVGPVLELAAAVPVLLLAVFVPREVSWVPLAAALLLALHASWRILQARMDRFVITNMRVFRVHGILSQNIATMPISRILDISVRKPFVGRILGYGHFIFESAAQEQGLREIRFVGSPNERGLTIQRVIQRSGLRGNIRPAEPARTQPPWVASEPAATTAPLTVPMRMPTDGGTDEAGTTAPLGMPMPAHHGIDGIDGIDRHDGDDEAAVTARIDLPR